MKLLLAPFIFSFLYILAPYSYAVPIVDVTKIKESQNLFGPWAFAPVFISSYSDPKLDKEAILLPQFLENKMDNPKAIITLALTLKTVPNRPLAINLKQPYTAWKLYADGKLIGSSGELHPSTGIHSAHPSYPINNFTPTRDKTQLLLYVGNSQHQHIGFYGVPIIAEKGVLEKRHIQSSIIEKIVVTILGVFGLYHIGLFWAWRRDKVPLWFALVCISITIRTMTTGEKILLEFFPNISWEMLTRIEYVSGYMALPFFVLYFSALYPKQSSRTIASIYLSLGIVFAIFALFFSTQFFTATLQYYEIIVVTFIVYVVYVSLLSLRAKEPASAFALIAFMIFSATIVHDLLRFENLIPSTTDLLPFGFVFYLFAQASILLLRYANTFHLIEKHTNNLEQLVGERTKELSLLLSQRDLLLRELTHRVKNNLQFIVGLLWIQRKEADPQTNTALKTLESQIQSIAAVHESLCSQDTITTIEIHDYIRKLILSLKRLHSDLEISLDSHEPIYIQTDHTISLGLIINELITNHIKYSNSSESRPIHIFIEKLLENNVVLHYNDGIDHRETFKKTQTSSSFGLPKLGWSMIKEFVKQMDATISVYHDHLDLHFLACENI